MSWFVRHRQDWIAEMLNIYGFINREHLVKKFDLSAQAASGDLTRFMDDRPGEMCYNVKTKRYEAIKKGPSDHG